MIVSPDYTLTHDGGALSMSEENPGTVKLDAGSAPFGTGTLMISAPSAAVIASLDPLQSPPPRVYLTAHGRPFNLCVRSRDIGQDDPGHVTLTVATDETLLLDYRALADDNTPLTYQDSLRGLVGYVLGTVIPGTALEAGVDFPVPALAASTNLVRNPRRAAIWDWQAQAASGPLDFGGYGAGGPSYAPSFYYFGASGGTVTDPYHYYDEANLSVRGGERYTVSVDVQVPTGKTATIDAVLFDSSGNVVGYATPTTVGGASGLWQRHALEPVMAPQTAVRMRPRVLIYGTLESGQYVNVTAWRVSPFTGDPADIDYYAGDLGDTAFYGYGFADDPWASPSRRVPLVDAADPQALIWTAGQSAMEFLGPLVQRFGLRLVCDELRRWTLRTEGHLVPGNVNIRAGVNMSAGSENVTRDGGLWRDAQVTRYIHTSPDGVRTERVDSYALNDPPTLVHRVEVQAAYPGPGRSEYAVKRSQGRGREVTASRTPDWTETPEQSASISLAGAPTQSGRVQSVEFDLDANEVTITTRTIDTPDAAWVLLDVGETWLDSPAGESWTEEAA